MIASMIASMIATMRPTEPIAGTSADGRRPRAIGPARSPRGPGFGAHRGFSLAPSETVRYGIPGRRADYDTPVTSIRFDCGSVRRFS